MRIHLFAILVAACALIMISAVSRPCAAIEYETIVVNDDSVHVGIPGVRVIWAFPEATDTTYTDANGKTTWNYNGAEGLTTVSIRKQGYYPVNPSSGVIQATTDQRRYYFTMLPN